MKFYVIHLKHQGSHLCDKHNTREIGINISTKKKKHVPFSLRLCLCVFHLCYAYRTSANQASSHLCDKHNTSQSKEKFTYHVSHVQDWLHNWSVIAWLLRTRLLLILLVCSLVCQMKGNTRYPLSPCSRYRHTTGYYSGKIVLPRKNFPRWIYPGFHFP